MLIDTRCVFCAKPISGGGMVALDDVLNLKIAWDQSIGQICKSCQTVSCQECSKRGIDINSLDEIERAKCLKCGEKNHNKVAVITTEILSPSTAVDKKQNGIGIPDWVISVSAVIIFLLLSGAPLTDGKQALIIWLGDGGFIYLGGAAILGYFAPKFMPKN